MKKDLLRKLLAAASKVGTIEHVISGHQSTRLPSVLVQTSNLRGAHPQLFVTTTEECARKSSHRHLQPPNFPPTDNPSVPVNDEWVKCHDTIFSVFRVIHRYSLSHPCGRKQTAMLPAQPYFHRQPVAGRARNDEKSIRKSKKIFVK